MKKALITLLCLCFAATSFVGCKGTSKSKDNGGDPNKPFELSMTLMGGPKTADTPIQKELEKRLNVKFNFVMLPGWDEKNVKTNLLMSDPKTMPDVLWWTGQDKEFKQWIDAGLVVDMLPLLKKYGKDIIKYYGKDVLFYSYDNGKIHKVPGDVAEASCMTTIIRQDWLDKLGMQVPKTLDEYVKVITAFTKNDPDGNGKDDTFGLSGPKEWRSFAPILYPLRSDPDNFVVTSDGTVKHGSVLPQTKEALKILSELYKEKVIDPGMLTQDGTAFEQALANGKMGSFYRWVAYFNPGGSVIEGFKAKNPDAKLAYIDPIVGPDGFSSDEPEDPAGWCYVSVTKHAADPEKTVETLNKIIDPEIFKLWAFGIEGKHYAVENGQYKKLSDPKDDAAEGIGLLTWILARKDSANIANTPEVNELFKKRAETSQPMKETRVRFKEKTRPAWAEYGTDLTTLRDKVFYEIIAGTSDISAFDKYVEDFYAQGGTEVEKEANELYGKQKKEYEDFTKVYDGEIASGK